MKLLLALLTLFAGGGNNDSPVNLPLSQPGGGSSTTPISGTGHAIVLESAVWAGDAALLSFSNGQVLFLNPAPDSAALTEALSAPPLLVATLAAAWKDAAGIQHMVEVRIYDNDDDDSIKRKEKLFDLLLRSQQNLYPPVNP